MNKRPTLAKECVCGHWIWSKEEEEYMKQHYKGTADAAAVSEYLCRSTNSIQMKAHELGLVKFKCVKWTNADEQYLRANYKNMTCAAMAAELEVSADAVKYKLRAMGVRNKN